MICWSNRKPQHATPRATLRLIALTGCIAALVSAPFFILGDSLGGLFSGDGMVEWLRSFGSIAWLAAFGLLLSDIALPIPTTAVMAALGMIYGPLTGGIAASAGSVLSGLAAYGLCRYLGRPIVLRIADETALAAGKILLAKAGGWVVTFSRWVPVAAEIVACLAGIMLMPFRVFSGALLCGSVPLGFTFATIGHAGTEYPLLTLVGSAIAPLFLWALCRPLFQVKSRG